jgi:hypothetical protein
MNFFEGKGIKSRILPFLCIFIYFFESVVYTGGKMHCLHAQELPQDTLSDTTLTFQSADSTENIHISPVYSPPFILPDTVEGYILSNIHKFASANCPAKEILRSTLMDLYSQLVDDSLLNHITPMFVYILKMNPDRTVIQVYREQYTISPGKNLIRFSVDFPPGNYQLIYGFYLRDQINERFPRFYGKRCRFRMIEAVTEQQ